MDLSEALTAGDHRFSIATLVDVEQIIEASLDVNLGEDFQHHDLMLDCWRNNLYGGFKAVEVQLDIQRQVKGINGWEAVNLATEHAGEVP